MIILKLNKQAVAKYSGNLRSLKDNHNDVGAWIKDLDVDHGFRGVTKLHINCGICKINVNGFDIWFDELEVSL